MLIILVWYNGVEAGREKGCIGMYVYLYNLKGFFFVVALLCFVLTHACRKPET